MKNQDEAMAFYRLLIICISLLDVSKFIIQLFACLFMQMFNYLLPNKNLSKRIVVKYH